MLNRITLALAVVSAVSLAGAVHAQDQPSETSNATGRSANKEGLGTKIKHAPGTLVKDTEGGVKRVGSGTKKVVTGTGHEMGKLAHFGRKKKNHRTAHATANGTGTNTDSGSATQSNQSVK